MSANKTTEIVLMSDLKKWEVISAKSSLQITKSIRDSQKGKTESKDTKPQKEQKK